MAGLASIWSNRRLRSLLTAQIPADFADWLDFVAIGALLAFSWNAPPMVFAGLAVAMGLPYLVIGPFAGVLVDRADARSVMILANLGRGAVTAACFFAPDWPVLLALVAARSAVDTAFTPAKQAALQGVVAPEGRGQANAISHAINQASKVAAPAIGGGLLIWFQPQTVFLLNAAVSLLAAVLLVPLGPVRAAAAEAAPAGLFASVGQGFAEVRGAPVLRAALVLMAAGYFAMFFYDTLFAPMTRALGFTATDLGLALATVGGGGVLGAVLLSLVPMRRPFLWVALGSVVSGAAIIALGVAEMRGVPLHIGVLIGAFAVLGLSSALSVVPYRTILQNSVPEGAIGRVTALSEAANTAALLTSPFLGAMVAEAWSIGAAFVCGGVILLAIAGRAVMLGLHRG